MKFVCQGLVGLTQPLQGPAGTIEVKIHTPIGQVKRKFCEGGLYQVNNNLLSKDKSCKKTRPAFKWQQRLRMRQNI